MARPRDGPRSEKVGLLETRTEMRDGKPDVTSKDKEKDKDKKERRFVEMPFNYEKAILPERERPENTPGAVLRVKLDTRALARRRERTARFRRSSKGSASSRP